MRGDWEVVVRWDLEVDVRGVVRGDWEVVVRGVVRGDWGVDVGRGCMWVGWG